MKKLLLLLLLVGFNAEAIDYKNSIPTLIGLEGFDDFGIRVGVEDYSYKDKDFDQKAIADQVELRLRQAKLNYNKNGSTFLIVSANPVTLGGKIIGYSVKVSANRIAYFVAKSVEYKTSATVWSKGGHGPEIRPEIERLMDQFLLDYLKANPKKTEQ